MRLRNALNRPTFFMGCAQIFLIAEHRRLRPGVEAQGVHHGKAAREGGPSGLRGRNAILDDEEAIIDMSAEPAIVRAKDLAPFLREVFQREKQGGLVSIDGLHRTVDVAKELQA